MGTRVRKLAKELGGTPGEVLGLLVELGQDRYRSPEDMLPTPIATQVQRAWERGRRGVPVAVAENEPVRASSRAPQPDLMSQLVPGVVPTGAKAPRKKRPLPPPDAPVEAIAAPPPAEQALAAQKRDLDRAIARERATIEAVRADLEAERARVAALRAELDAAASALEAQRASLEAERAELARAREDFAAERAAEAARVRPGLSELLAERGLRGADEFERAVVALGATRGLRDLLPLLEVGDVPGARAVLKRSLLLVGGEVPEGLSAGTAVVQVAPERAEMPGWGELRRELGRAAEALMLHGLRFVVVSGAPPAWQRLIRDAFDPRLELRFTPVGVEDGGSGGRVDAIVRVNGDPGPGDPGARPLVLSVVTADLVGFARGLRDALTDS